MELVKKNEEVLVPQILEIIKLPSAKRRGSSSAISLKNNLMDKDASRSSLASLNTASVPNELKNNACILLNHLINDGICFFKYVNYIYININNKN